MERVWDRSFLYWLLKHFEKNNSITLIPHVNLHGIGIMCSIFHNSGRSLRHKLSLYGYIKFWKRGITLEHLVDLTKLYMSCTFNLHRDQTWVATFISMTWKQWKENETQTFTNRLTAQPTDRSSDDSSKILTSNFISRENKNCSFHQPQLKAILTIKLLLDQTVHVMILVNYIWLLL